MDFSHFLRLPLPSLFSGKNHKALENMLPFLEYKKYPPISFEYTASEGYLVAKIFGKQYFQFLNNLKIFIFLNIPKNFLSQQANIPQRLFCIVKYSL